MRRYRYMSVLTKSLASLHFQKMWATRWGELESRLCRVEMFMDLCGPITVAQHALLHSKSLRPTPVSIPPSIPHAEPTTALEGAAGSENQEKPTEEANTSEDERLDVHTKKSSGGGNDKSDDRDSAKDEHKMYYERELGQAKDIYHQVRYYLPLRLPPPLHVIDNFV